MEVAKQCEYCHQREAVTTCKMCGAAVCEKHNKDYGCSVCGGDREI